MVIELHRSEKDREKKNKTTSSVLADVEKRKKMDTELGEAHCQSGRWENVGIPESLLADQTVPWMEFSNIRWMS